MKKMILLCFMSLSLSACAQTRVATAPSVAEKTDYHVHGTEPFWSLTIGPKQTVYSSASGGKPRTFATPQLRPSFNGTRYVAKNIAIDITHSICSDGMSDRRYADTVTFAMDGKTLRGCGGTILPPGDLANTHWTITAINDAASIESRDARLDFVDGKLSGSAGCNRFNANYKVKAEKMMLGTVISTRMACAADIMAQENSVLNILGRQTSIRYTPDGKLLLSNDNGIIVLERIF